MTGGAALARQLRAQGVEVIFGLPGDQLMAALDALVDVPEIRYLVTRHEQATTYMADGYARAGGRPGVAMVVPGVGVYNAASGLATAYACSSPVLLIAGQVNRAGIGRDLGLLHDLHDQLDVVRPDHQVGPPCARPRRDPRRGARCVPRDDERASAARRRSRSRRRRSRRPRRSSCWHPSPPIRRASTSKRSSGPPGCSPRRSRP